mmetsp:Transcript_29238/g.69133  ORF Transcript_29238/g.69133 Transcript_29238/m.69133 type:complete len:112 (-) Transcript_29238:252-587(-)
MVFSLAAGSPAELSGRIFPGDILVEVDGVVVKGFSPEAVAPLVVGEVGSTVNLTFERGEEDSPSVHQVSVRRAWGAGATKWSSSKGGATPQGGQATAMGNHSSLASSTPMQ